MCSIWPLVVALLFVFEVLAEKPCIPKKYSGADNNIVCVCNSTYCDELERVSSIPEKSAIVITSSLDGDRFSRSVVKLGSSKKDFPSITVDARRTYQEILGFGGAFTDSAGINIAKLSEKTQDALMQTYFGEKGLEYTLGRVPIASTDFSTHEYSYDDIQGDFQLTRFALTKEDLQYKIPNILRALNLTRQNMALYASPWSAPGWMKTTNRMKGGGALREGKQYHQSYANYLVRFFEEYAKHGVPFWGMTIQNEPTSGAIPDYGWQTMLFTAATQRDFVKNFLGPALKFNNETKNLKVMALDDNRMMLPGWADIMFNDSSVSGYVDGIGVHWYGNNYFPSFVLTTTHNRHPDKFILGTEACAGYVGHRGPITGDWFRAENYAEDILTDLNHFVAGWTDWNLCLDETGGPNWVNNFVDAPIIVNGTADEFYKQPMFYALGHFSKFIRPGAKRVFMKTRSLPSTIHLTATVDNGRRTVVLLNRGSAAINISIGEVNNDHDRINILIKAHSIYTVIWDKS